VRAWVDGKKVDGAEEAEEEGSTGHSTVLQGVSELESCRRSVEV
jgi:hypothetical protein